MGFKIPEQNSTFNVRNETETTSAEFNLHEDEIDNLDENERVTARSDSGTGTKNSEVSISKSRSQFIILFALVMLMCAVLICTAVAAFVEISRLNSELASIQKSTSLSNQTTESIAFQEALAHINSSVQMIKMRFSQDLSAIENQTMAIRTSKLSNSFLCCYCSLLSLRPLLGQVLQ